METYSSEFLLQNETFKFIFAENRNHRYKTTSLKSRMQKTKFKIFIFQRDIFKIQSCKTHIGLHGEGVKSNLSDREL